MKRAMKKRLSILLAAMMLTVVVFTSVPSTAFAAENEIPVQPVKITSVNTKEGIHTVYSSPKTDEAYVMGYINGSSSVNILSVYFAPGGNYFYADCILSGGQMVRGYISRDILAGNPGTVYDFRPVCGIADIKTACAVRYGISPSHGTSDFTLAAGTSVDILYKVQGSIGSEYYVFVKFTHPASGKSGYGYINFNNLINMNIWENIKNFGTQSVSIFRANIKSDTVASRTFPVYSSPKNSEAVITFNVPQGASINLLSYTVDQSTAKQYILIDYYGTDGKGYRGYIEKENVVWEGFDYGNMPVNDQLTVKGTGTMRKASVVWHGQNELYFAASSFSLPAYTAVEIISYAAGVFDTQFAYIRYKIPGSSGSYGYGYMDVNNIAGVIAA